MNLDIWALVLASSVCTWKNILRLWCSQDRQGQAARDFPADQEKQSYQFASVATQTDKHTKTLSAKPSCPKPFAPQVLKGFLGSA